MSKLLLFIVFSLIGFSAGAQKTNINGQVLDSSFNRKLGYATLSLIREKDSSLVAFTQSDTAGNFLFTNIAYGNYIISCSFTGYKAEWIPVSVKDRELHLRVYMRSVNEMEGITVVAKRPPVVFNNDTLEFNTEHFKTQPNAVVEELLKRLPGMTIDADGTVRMNGRAINKILVNGKEFFTGDPKMATKNLPADMVDKVQLFEKASALSELTGFDDGKSETTLNLKLKKDRNNALFGRSTAGGGLPGRYEGHTNINKFADEQQASLIGMGSNTNKQGFSTYDILSFTGELSERLKSGNGGISITNASESNLPLTDRGMNQQGVSNTFLGGINFNDSWNKDRTLFSGNFITSNVHLGTSKRLTRNYLYPGNHYLYNQQLNGVNNLAQKRLGLSVEHRADSAHSIKFSSKWGLQNQFNKTEEEYLSEGASILNTGSRSDSMHNRSVGVSMSLLFRKKFKRRGRTISLNGDWVRNNKDFNGLTDNRFTFYPNSTPIDSVLNQSRINHNRQNSWSGSLTYTEPAGKRSLLEFTTSMFQDFSSSKRDVFDYSANTREYDLWNSILSNHYQATYSYFSSAVGLRTKRRGYSVGMEAKWQSSLLKGYNYSMDQKIRKVFHDLLPSFNIQAKTNRGGSVNLNYTTSTQQPTIQQLQPVADLSNPLNVLTGNPALKPSYQHNINVQYLMMKAASGRSIFTFISWSRTDRAIAYIDEILPGAIRTARPVNVDGLTTIYGNSTFGFPLRSINSRIDLSIGGNTSRSVSFINGKKNNLKSSGISPLIRWRYALDQKLELMSSVRMYFNNARYSLLPNFNNRYTQQIYNFDMVWYISKGVVFNSSISHTKNGGRSEGFNSGLTLWNVSVARSVLAGKNLEFKLSVYNILNTDLGIRRMNTPTYLEDSRYNVLGQCAMLSCTYSFTRLPGKKQ